MKALIYAALLLVGAGWPSGNAAAQEGKAPWEEFDKRLKHANEVTVLGNELFGDSVSLADGGLSFRQVDVEMPGNNALPVVVARSYQVFNRLGHYPTGPFADWELDVPNISGVFAPNWTVGQNPATAARCSSDEFPTYPLRDYYWWDFWHGNMLHIPGVGGGPLLKPSIRLPVTTSSTSVWSTADHIRVSCLPTIKNSVGEGFLAVAPDGTKYWFDWMAQYPEPQLIMSGRTDWAGALDPNPVQRRKNVLYATRVEDRFGNSVVYNYSNTWNAPARLDSIIASDGRQIALNYNGSRVISIVAAGKAWTYSYGQTARRVEYGHVNGDKATLAAVVRPDGSSWSIDFGQLTDAMISYRVGNIREPSRSCLGSDSALNVEVEPVGRITHPSGAVGTFRVGIREHGRSNVPLTCQNVTTTPSTGYLGQGNDPSDDTPVHGFAFETFSILEKTIAGVGLEPRSWTYSYAGTHGFFFTPGATVRYPVCHPYSASCWTPKCLSDECAGSEVTTVTAPDGSWVRYTYGNSYRYNEGKLLKIEHAAADGSVIRTEKMRYDLSLADHAYPAEVGTSNRPGDEAFGDTYTRPLLSKSIVQDGLEFRWDVLAECNSDFCLDVFARPIRVRSSSGIAP